MKNLLKRTHSIFAAPVLILLLTALTSCDHLFSPPLGVYTPGEGSGRAVIRLSVPEARTVMPSFTFAQYEISFASNDGLAEPDPITINGGSASASVTLPVGSWTITAKGKVNIGGTLKVVAQGSSTITVLANKNNSVNIRLSAQMTGDNGTLSYDKDEFLGWTVTSASIKVTSLADAAITKTANLLDTGTTQNPGSFSLTPGYYLVLITASSSGMGASISEVAHIHPGLTTTLPFVKNDFNFVPVYSITNAAATNGTITSNPSSSAPEGSTVTLVVQANFGYALMSNSLKVKYGNNQTIIPDPAGAGLFTFTMPQGNVTISAEFSVPSVIPENWNEEVFLGGSFNGIGVGGGVFLVNELFEPGSRSIRGARNAVERTDALIPLLGSIADDGKIFELTGFMDPDTRQFFIGGGKDDLVYSITGSMDTAGQLEISFIDIRQKDLSSGEWKADELPFIQNDYITPPTRPNRPTEAGIPSFFWGKWGDLPTCYTCGAPLPCPQNHLGCPCDNGNYCPQHTVCDDCVSNGLPSQIIYCPLHCQMCRNGQYCWEHPCNECGPNGHPPCPLHCHACRDGNWCQEHPCKDCGEWGFPPCVAHCMMCRNGHYCTDHGTGGGKDPGTGGDKRSVITKSLLLNASRSVNARSARNIIPANAEDQESIIISQFGISKSRPWMEYLREKADEQYQEFLAGNTGYNELISVPSYTDSRKYWKATETYFVFYNGGGNGNSLADVAVLDILAEAYGYPNKTAYLAALRHRFENEAETQIKKDDINFLEYWEEGGNHNILGYKKEFESVWSWSEATHLLALLAQVEDMASADNDRIRPLLNGYIESVLEEYMASTKEVAEAREAAWMTWWEGGMHGEEPVRTYRGTEECPWPTITTPKGRILSFSGNYTTFESNGNLYDGSTWGVYLQAYPDYITPAEEWPSIQFNGKTLKIYGRNLYLNDICIGDTGFWSLVSIIENDPDYRGYKFGDNVYVRVSVTNNNGIISIGELDGYRWDEVQELAPVPPEWWVEGTNYDNGDSGNWPYYPGEMINVWKLINMPIHEAKEMGVWAGRKITRW